MIVLGSQYQAVVDAVRAALDGEAEVRDFDPARPLAEQVADIDVLLLGSFHVTEDILAAAPRLRLIHQHGTGVDGVALRAATERRVAVVKIPCANSTAVAEHCLALVLLLGKRLLEARPAVAAQRLGTPTGMALAGKTLGIVGRGATGASLGRMARALGMRVLATRSCAGAPDDCADFVGGPEHLGRLLDEADFLSLHLPLTEATRGLIGARELARMKRSAYLINAARAALVDYEALVDALGRGTIAGAAFDVFWQEPANPADPICALPHFVLTPHVAGFTDGTVQSVARVIADNVRLLARGAPLSNVVNPEVAVA